MMKILQISSSARREASHSTRLATRVVQRLPALNAAIWWNWTIGAHPVRSLTAYDHVAVA